MPPMQAGAPSGAQPAKTMFGHVAPVVPRAPAPPGPAAGPGAPAPGLRPPGPAGAPAFAPQPQQGFAPPPGAQPAQPAYGQPPQPAGYPPPAAPAYQAPSAPAPQAAPNPYGQPGYGQPPAANPYGQPAANPYGQPAANPYGQPQAPANPYGQPAAANPYGQPPAAPYGQPQPSPNPYGQAPAANPYGQPAPAYGQPPAANPYGQPPAAAPYGHPDPGNPYGAAPQANPYAQAPQGYPNAPGPLDDLARKLPQSAPGTVFGFPVAKLRDPALQRKALFVLGIALLASIIVPIAIDPKLTFVWSGAKLFRPMIWPILAGASYLLVAAAPPDVRAKVPPVVLQWLPFVVSFIGIQLTGIGFGGLIALFSFLGYPGGLGGEFYLYTIGMSVLLFGMLARLANPADKTAGIITAVGSGCLLLFMLSSTDMVFRFSGDGLQVVHNILFIVVMLVGIACGLYAVPAAKLPPGLRPIESLAPLFTAVLVVWMPIQVLLMSFGMGSMFGGEDFMMSLLTAVRGVLYLVAYFGVLMLTAPAAYDAIMAMVRSGGGGGGGGYQPPGGYPPGGGYPPPGGGYPPPGGGYPPQGGGYPPQGGGYPPQGGGGGWPQQ